MKTDYARSLYDICVPRLWQCVPPSGRKKSKIFVQLLPVDDLLRKVFDFSTWVSFFSPPLAQIFPFFFQCRTIYITVLFTKAVRLMVWSNKLYTYTLGSKKQKRVWSEKYVGTIQMKRSFQKFRPYSRFSLKETIRKFNYFPSYIACYTNADKSSGDHFLCIQRKNESMQWRQHKWRWYKLKVQKKNYLLWKLSKNFFRPSNIFFQSWQIRHMFGEKMFTYMDVKFFENRWQTCNVWRKCSRFWYSIILRRNE